MPAPEVKITDVKADSTEAKAAQLRNDETLRKLSEFIELPDLEIAAIVVCAKQKGSDSYSGKTMLVGENRNPTVVVELLANVVCDSALLSEGALRQTAAASGVPAMLLSLMLASKSKQLLQAANGGAEGVRHVHSGKSEAFRVHEGALPSPNVTPIQPPTGGGIS